LTPLRAPACFIDDLVPINTFAIISRIGLYLGKQIWLITLDLHKIDNGCPKMQLRLSFFWQCKASIVKSSPFTSSASTRRRTVEISLPFLFSIVPQQSTIPRYDANTDTKLTKF
jgi:hypothetical protein